MIARWDDLFVSLNDDIGTALDGSEGRKAFELMHLEPDRVWNEAFRVLINGGWAGINIGDATRSVGNSFQLYSNHARILESCFKLGFDILPIILWRKQTNAPNKFMGSGMLNDSKTYNPSPRRMRKIRRKYVKTHSKFPLKTSRETPGS